MVKTSIHRCAAYVVCAVCAILVLHVLFMLSCVVFLMFVSCLCDVYELCV